MGFQEKFARGRMETGEAIWSSGSEIITPQRMKECDVLGKESCGKN